MVPRLIELMEKCGGQRILLVGDLILDRYVYGDAERISPEAPVAVLRKKHEEHRVGGAGNVAANLCALNIAVHCCGAVGADDAGSRLRALLQSQGIDTRGLLSLTDRPTTTKTRFIGLAQHRHRQQLIRVDEETTSPLDPPDTDRLAKIILQAIAGVGLVCLEDYNKGLLSEHLCQQVITKAAALGKSVLVDPAPLSDYNKYRGATILTPNRAEFLKVCPCPNDSVETILAHSSQVIDKYALGGLLITLDRDGTIMALANQPPLHIPTRPRNVYDNTGAGDAVLAMLAAARAAGADWEEAAKLTNVAGGLEVEKFGCVPITREEMLAELRMSLGADASKIRRPEELADELTLRKTRGEIVVFTNGCFDLLHAGHVRFLQECRAQGDVLVVGLNSDASVRAQNKGNERPIVPQDQRAEVLAAMQSVDYVVLFDEPTPQNIIEKVSPNVLIKGQDWSDRGVVGQEHVEAGGGRVVLLPLVEGISTTQIVNRIRSRIKS
ncbi:MAG: D-glycero-beta-D-manno-heptose 1-phosphate adenylyltransferase [Phycisphaerales bacterium]|nr:D-glycero-beta-D-manno-heptose 1-phosphate adenylyltransferase [Phycisphaerales bacterium]